MSDRTLVDFVRESNRIERIDTVSLREIEAYVGFFDIEVMRVHDVRALAGAVADTRLRSVVGIDRVITGSRHRPPPGGPEIEERLQVLLDEVNNGRRSAHAAHCEFERLHPFTDGNGRVGRALWAWQMMRVGSEPFAFPFLQMFYYQSLDAYSEAAVGRVKHRGRA